MNAPICLFCREAIEGEHDAEGCRGAWFGIDDRERAEADERDAALARAIMARFAR